MQFFRFLKLHRNKSRTSNCCIRCSLVFSASSAASASTAAAVAATCFCCGCLCCCCCCCCCYCTNADWSCSVTFSLPTLLRKLYDGCCTALSEKFRVRILIECLRNYVSKKLLAFREKKQIALPPSFWCVYDRGKQNPAGDAFEIEKGNGDVRDYNRRTAAAVVLYDTSTRCMYSSLAPLVPGAAYLVPGTVHASTQQTIQIRGTGVRLARKNSL